MVQRFCRFVLFRVGGVGGALFSLLLVISLLSGARAQGVAHHYFPETGHYVQGPFLLFWQTQGGVEIFGYPITEQYDDPHRDRVVQYFERARFELADLNGAPYVELGRLGAEVTQGREFQTTPPIEPSAEWRYFPETQHIIQHGFKQFWEMRGGRRIFGLPLSEEISELSSDGTYRTVQYFERARFEYWPELPPGRRIVLGSLGRTLAPSGLQTPLPPGTPPGTLPPGWSSIVRQHPQTPFLPESINASVTPTIGTPGDSFVFTAHGFAPDERVGIWLTTPDYTPVDLGLHVRANASGSLERITIETEGDAADGVWAINAEGMESGRGAVGYFRLSQVLNAPPGNPAILGLVQHDLLPAAQNTFIVPLLAPAGTSFTLVASGFHPDEQIIGWLTDPNQRSTPLESEHIQRDQSGIVQATIASKDLPDGIYTVVVKGQMSKLVRWATFQVWGQYAAAPGTPRPPNTGGSVSPAEGPPGTVFQVRGEGMQPGEPVEFWMTDPVGRYTLVPDPLVADAQGRVGYTPPLDIVANQDFTPGVYGFHFRGKASGARADGYCTVRYP